MPASDCQTLTWSLFADHHGRTGAENMAIDQALLEEAERSGDAFLRLYRWSPPCLSFGRNEPALQRYDRAAIERRGIDVVRRPTGGRAVWHDAEVTYAVAAPIAMFGSLRDSYRAIHERLAVAVRHLGVPAELAADGQRPTAVGSGACFSESVGSEIIVNGRKLVGSAQVRSGGAFLQHGSILLGGSQNMVAAVSRRPSAVSRATTLREVLGRPVSFQEVTDAIVETWGETLTARPPDRQTAVTDLHWTWRR
jgi:lipoate-protein ligase A